MGPDAKSKWYYRWHSSGSKVGLFGITWIEAPGPFKQLAARSGLTNLGPVFGPDIALHGEHQAMTAATLGHDIP